MISNAMCIGKYSESVYFLSVACPATSRDGLHTWPLAHAPELPLVDPLAERAGESSGENDEASSRLQTVAYHCSYLRVPYWHTTGNSNSAENKSLNYYFNCTEIAQSSDRAS